MPRKMLILIVLLATVLATGPLAMAQPLLRPPSVEDRLAELAAQIPGFGGLYYDQNGKPNVWLVGSSGLGMARQRFGADARVHPARYAFTEFRQWRDRLRGVLGVAGVVLLDLDEARNRLVIGVERGSAARDRHAVDRHVAAQRVPLEAVIVEETDPIQRLQTLRDPFYPVPGGVQISFSRGTCTLGFNAFSNYGFGFVTNSHCTDIQGGVEGTAYFQPDFSGNYIGQEVADPFYFSCGGGRVCRYSDSAFAVYNSFDLGEFAAIAKPDFDGRCAGSINVDPTLPRFTIRSRQQFPYVGEVLDKVGRTTGWTFGNVSATCVDTNVALSNVTMLCQDFVDAGSQPGDSGSPVFRWNGFDDVTLYGVLWGNSGSCRLVFSALANIEYELGPLAVH